MGHGRPSLQGGVGCSRALLRWIRQARQQGPYGSLDGISSGKLNYRNQTCLLIIQPHSALDCSEADSLCYFCCSFSATTGKKATSRAVPIEQYTSPSVPNSLIYPILCAFLSACSRLACSTWHILCYHLGGCLACFSCFQGY